MWILRVSVTLFPEGRFSGSLPTLSLTLRGFFLSCFSCSTPYLPVTGEKSPATYLISSCQSWRDQEAGSVVLSKTKLHPCCYCKKALRYCLVCLSCTNGFSCVSYISCSCCCQYLCLQGARQDRGKTAYSESANNWGELGTVSRLAAWHVFIFSLVQALCATNTQIACP